MNHYYSSSASTSNGVFRLLNVLAVLLHVQVNLAVPFPQLLPDVVESPVDMVDLAISSVTLQDNIEQTTEVDQLPVPSSSTLGDTNSPSPPSTTSVLNPVLMANRLETDATAILDLSSTMTMNPSTPSLVAFTTSLSRTTLPPAPASVLLYTPSTTLATSISTTSITSIVSTSSAVFSSIPFGPSPVILPPHSTASIQFDTGSSTSETQAFPTLSAVLPLVSDTPHPSLAVTSMHVHSGAPASPDPTQTTDEGDVAAASHRDRTPMILGLVLLGLLLFSLGTCFLVYVKRMRNALFGGLHRDVDVFTKDLEKSTFESEELKPASSGASAEKSLPSMLPPWVKLPSQISPFVPRDSLFSFLSPRNSTGSIQSRPRPFSKMPQTKSGTRLKNKVIDIVPDFPRSRFSVSSSDYAQSVHTIGSDSSEDDENFADAKSPPAEGNPTREVPLLTPAEFFSMPTSTSLASGASMVSRRSSAPVFGGHRRVAGVSMALSSASTVKTLNSTRDSVLLARGRSRSKSMSASSSKTSLRRTKSMA